MNVLLAVAALAMGAECQCENCPNPFCKQSQCECGKAVKIAAVDWEGSTYRVSAKKIQPKTYKEFLGAVQVDKANTVFFCSIDSDFPGVIRFDAKREGWKAEDFKAGLWKCWNENGVPKMKHEAYPTAQVKNDPLTVQSFQYNLNSSCPTCRQR